MAELIVPQIHFAPPGQLGKVHKEAQDRRTLADLGKGARFNGMKH